MSIKAKMSLSTGNFSQLQSYLEGAVKKANDPKPLLTIIGSELRRIPLEAFRKQADPATGQPWTKRQPVSLLSRRGKGGKMMSGNTNQLLPSYNVPPLIKGNQVSIGSNVPYARIHQFGGTIKAKGAYLTVPLKVMPPGTRIKAWKDQMKAAKKNVVYRDAKNRTQVVGIMEKKGRGKKATFKFTPYWWLVKQVVIPARPLLGFGDHHKENFIKKAEQYLAYDKRKRSR